MKRLGTEGARSHRWAQPVVLLVIAAMTILSISACGTAADAAKGKAPNISFGITGGNMVPWFVILNPNGTVESNHKTKKVKSINAASISKLVKAAAHKGFYTWPKTPGRSNPDVAHLYIRIGSRIAYVPGGKKTAKFNGLLHTLEHASTLKYCSSRPC